ncbi:MAG: DUF5333 domain-containing protein [Paracoccaceae bacterium]
MLGETFKPTRILAGAGLSLLLLVCAASAQDRTPINQEKHINASLLSAAIGKLIQDECTTIKPRMMLAIWKANELNRYARKLGYSKTEIRSFVESKTEQKRMRRDANHYLKSHGVIKGNAATYCAVGRSEINRGTLTGTLLRGS